MADFYFGSTTPNTGGNFEVYGPTGSRPEVIGNVQAPYILVVPAGGITITELERGLNENTAGGTVEVGVYDAADDSLIVGGTVTITGGGPDNYIWHNLSGLSTFVAEGTTIYAVSAQPDVDVFGTADAVANGVSETDSASQTLPDPFSGSAFTLAPPIRVGYSLGGGAVPSIDTYDDPVRLNTTSNHTVSDFGSAINQGNIAQAGIQTNGTSPSDTQITWPAQAQNLVTPELGLGNTFTLGDGTDTANVSIEFLPETGFTFNSVGTVAAGLTESDWGFGLGLESNQDGYTTRDADSAFVIHNSDGTSSWFGYGTSLLYSWDRNAVIGDDGGWTEINLTNSPAGDAPELNPTQSYNAQTNATFSRVISQSGGDPATSWAIVGGPDQAEYSIDNNGRLTRDIPNPVEETESVDVQAANSSGVSNTMVVTITYRASQIPPTKYRRFPWQPWVEA